MDSKLEQQILKDLSSVLPEVLRQSKQLLTKTINQTVYSGARPKVYERTYTFANAWQVGKQNKNGNGVSQNLEYDYDVMVYNGNDYVHGDSRIDRRPIMANILENQNANKKNSNFGGALNIKANEKDNYWEKFKSQLDTEIYKYLDNELGKYGMVRR